MREHKYRAWHIEHKKMLEGATLRQWLFDAASFGNAVGHLQSRLLQKGIKPLVEVCEDDYDHLIFLEFTGLLDKNGIEIYEGDILDPKYLVQWNEKDAQYEAKAFGYGAVPFAYFSEMDRKVIGNIYENLELLKGEP
jgi:uncharacterized phage protein (TIGR01671 family)